MCGCSGAQNGNKSKDGKTVALTSYKQASWGAVTLLDRKEGLIVCGCSGAQNGNKIKDGKPATNLL